MLISRSLWRRIASPLADRAWRSRFTRHRGLPSRRPPRPCPRAGARALVGFAPMQFEGFQREVGEPAPERVVPPPLEGHPDMARLGPIAKQHGFEILGPPGPPPGR